MEDKKNGINIKGKLPCMPQAFQGFRGQDIVVVTKEVPSLFKIL